MSAHNPTFAEETINAAQGGWRLLIGRRDAPQYFLEDTRALVSSFIALLISIAITLAASALMRPTGGELTSFVLVFTNAVLYAALVGASWVVLRFAGKADRFVAFLTVDNWLNALISVVLALIGLFGVGSDVVLLAAVVAGLAARINNARLVVGLKAGQIVLLMIGQAVGVMVGLSVLGMFIPITPQ